MQQLPSFSCQLVNISVAGCRPFPALVIGDRAIPVTALVPLAAQLGFTLIGSDSMNSLLSHWQSNQVTLLELSTHLNDGLPAPSVSLEQIHVHAPVSPRQVFCTIGNYRSQLIEATVDAGRCLPVGERVEDDELRKRALAFIAHREKGDPYVCSKAPASVIGPFEDLFLEDGAEQVDWEVELAVVIGKPAYKIPVESALEHIAAYTVANDITRRDRVFRSDPPGFGTDWLQSKNSVGFLPLGPYLTPAACVPDYTALKLQLSLNGAVMQEETCGDMVFGIAQQIAYISQHVRLETGDVICTGSPAGFGIHHQRFLQPGDHVEASIAGLGSQRIRVLRNTSKLQTSKESQK